MSIYLKNEKRSVPDYWSLTTPIAYAPVSSTLVNLLYYGDKVLNTIFRWNHDTNCLGGDLYDLMQKGIFSFILEVVNKNPDIKAIPIRFATKRMVIINDTDLMRHILVRKGTKRGSNYDRLSEFFGYGIFTSIIKDRWSYQRNIVIHLLSQKNLCNSEQHLYDKTIQIIETIKGEIVDLPRLLSKIGLILFCDLILGIDVSDIGGDIINKDSDLILLSDNDDLSEWNIDEDFWQEKEIFTLSEDIDETLNYINGAIEPITIKFSPRYRKFIYHKNRVHNWMREVIRRIRRQHEPNNIISNDILVNEFINGDKITDEMVELLIPVILGGHETTARLMLGIIHSTIINPLIIDKVRNEDSILLGDDHQYINNVVNEGLRLFPPVWLISRESSDDINYKGIIIPRETPMLLSPLLIQRDKQIWGDNAEEFCPERFDIISDSTRFFPFGIGPEACPGKHFARLEAIIVIQALFQHYNVEIIGEHTLTPYSMGTFRLTKDLPVKITSG